MVKAERNNKKRPLKTSILRVIETEGKVHVQIHYLETVASLELEKQHFL